MPDHKVEQFLVVARSIGTFARALLDGAKKPQISLRLGAAAASRDITLVSGWGQQWVCQTPPSSLPSSMLWTHSTRMSMTSPRPLATSSLVDLYCVPMSWKPGHKVWPAATPLSPHPLALCVCVCSEEAKRFEEGLQEQKDFLYIQKKYVRTKNSSFVVSTRSFSFP